MEFKQVTIIGVGLIGGSLGLAIKDKKLASLVIGVGRREESILKAKHLNTIDQGTLDLRQGIENADLIIIATPIEKTVDIVEKSINFFKKGSLIIDVASTKSNIVRQIEKLIPEEVYYVGTHPIAGSEKKGVDFAEVSLFSGTNCIITETEQTCSFAIQRIVNFWEKLGCSVYVLSPDLHDKIVANISHLPHILAFLLIKNNKQNLKFAGDSFYDLTRIAESNSDMWTHIFIENKKYILETIKSFMVDLDKISTFISKEEKKKIRKLLKESLDCRMKLKRQIQK